MNPTLPPVRAVLLAGAILLALAPPLLANGGTVRVSREVVGPYMVSVFTSPTPLRTGEVDVSVLVQDTAGGAVLDVPVTVGARPVGFAAAPIRHPATRLQATNRLFKAAKFDIAEAGDWEITVQIGGAEGGAVAFEVALTDPTLLDRPYLLAALILLPLAVLGWLLMGRDEERRQSRIAATI